MSAHDGIRDALEHPPRIVTGQPRYQQEASEPVSDLPPRLAARMFAAVPTPVWHLDGVDWWKHDPPRRGHKHWPQTVIALGIFDEHWRCPCGAALDPYRPGEGWVLRDKPRVTGLPIIPAARPRRPALTGPFVQIVLGLVCTALGIPLTWLFPFAGWFSGAVWVAVTVLVLYPASLWALYRIEFARRT